MTSVQYIQIAPNIHLFTHKVDRYKVSYNIELTSAGAFFEQDTERGVSHLLEHCCVSRSKSLDFYQLQDFLFLNDIYSNASTGRLGMNFVIAGHRNDNIKMYDLIREFAFTPTFSTEILDQQRQIVLREINQRRGDPNYQLNKLVMNTVLEEGSLYTYEALGEIEDVKNATTEDLYKVHARALKQSHIVVSAVGDIDIEYLQHSLTEAAAAFSPAHVLPIDYLPKNTLKQFSYMPIVSSFAHDNAILDILIPFPVNMQTKAMSIFFFELMFNGTIGYLFNTLRNKHGLVYGLNAELMMSGNILSLNMTCDIENVKRIIDEVHKAFDNFDEIFSESKINIVKEIAIKKQEMSEDNPQNSIDFALNSLCDYGQIMHIDEFTTRIRNTTREDLKQLFDQTKSALEQMRVVVVSNKDEISRLI